MAFPATGILDTFTRADAVNLGSAWGVDVPGVGDVSFGVTANRAGYFQSSAGGGWVVAAPGSTGQPVTTVNDQSGPDFNVTTLTSLHDVITNGGGDSAILFQLNAGGSTLDRAQLNNVASRVVQGAGKHGIYAKAQNLTLQDVSMTPGPFVASGLSMREPGLVARRFVIGSNAARFPIALSYYETITTEGAVLCENMICYSSSDTVVWLSYDTDTSSVHQNFTFRFVQGFSTRWFLRVDRSIGAGLKAGKTITLDNCSLNDVRITNANLANMVDLSTVPSSAIVVL